MKGIVFNLLEECVRAEYGEETWDELLEAARLDGVYTSLATYNDEHLYALVKAAASKLGVEPNQVVHWFGARAAARFAQRYPAFYADHVDTRSFLLTLNTIIHPEVRKLYPGADVPAFRFETGREGSLTIHYHSRRKLCAFAEGLIEGSAQRFGERAHVEQPSCVHRGDEHCVLVVRFERAE